MKITEEELNRIIDYHIKLATEAPKDPENDWYCGYLNATEFTAKSIRRMILDIENSK